MRCSLLALALALAAAGCTPELCGRNSDCAYGLVCTNAGLCRPPPVDTGDSTDAGTDGATAADAAVDGQPIIEGQAEGETR
jgi:hypothetical protein